MPRRCSLFVLVWVALVAPVVAQVQADPPTVCESCDEWNARRAPFRVFGNTYFVGTAGLGSVLVTSEAGHVLLDGGLPQSAPEIDAHIRALGFRTADVKLIVTSHEHYDHVGGVAALQRASGARVASSPAGARALESGEPTRDDPQYGTPRFPRVARVQVVQDGDTLRVGPIAVTAHFTPGHTPGSTTWTWRSCEASRCLDVVYADSLNAISREGFRFGGEAGRPSRVDAFRKSIATVASLPCDIILSVHPDFINLTQKAARLAGGASPNPFVDPGGCRTYAADATRTLDRRLQDEARRK